jgi:hypothetical protein
VGIPRPALPMSRTSSRFTSGQLAPTTLKSPLCHRLTGNNPTFRSIRPPCISAHMVRQSRKGREFRGKNLPLATLTGKSWQRQWVI